MKRKALLLVMALVIVFSIILVMGCDASAQTKDRALVNDQQEHYAMVQPLPFFDYSIPRYVLTQIYEVVATEARSTYTIIESMTGETKFHGPSLGYGIPVDTQLTNPLMSSYTNSSGGVTIEQPEPNGLFSSKNTDGTWVLFVDNNGDVTPIYTEHKVTTFPFAVIKSADGSWVRAGNEPATLTIELPQ